MEDRQLVIELFVKDLKRSIKFYRRLGFKLARREKRFCVLSWEGHPLFLAQESQAPRAGPWPAGNLRVMVKDVDSIWARLRRARVKSLIAIADRYYGLRDFTVADPDGFAIRFASRLLD